MLSLEQKRFENLTSQEYALAQLSRMLNRKNEMQYLRAWRGISEQDIKRSEFNTVISRVVSPGVTLSCDP